MSLQAVLGMSCLLLCAIEIAVGFDTNTVSFHRAKGTESEVLEISMLPAIGLYVANSSPPSFIACSFRISYRSVELQHGGQLLCLNAKSCLYRKSQTVKRSVHRCKSETAWYMSQRLENMCLLNMCILYVISRVPVGARTLMFHSISFS